MMGNSPALPLALTAGLAVGVVAAGCADRRAADDAGQASVQTLLVTDSVDHLDVAAREPMVVEHPDGTLFVSGYWEPLPTLWKSLDRGASWRRVDVGTAQSGAAGNSDVDLAVAPDGTLYFVTMVFDRAKLEGTSVQIGVSTDVGATWKWHQLSRTRFDDRPWVEAGRDGTAHVIWNDGDGVSHAVSTDGGTTWTERPRVAERGGSSHLALGPGTEVAVRVVPLSASGNRFDVGVELIVVSGDGGLTWERHTPPGEREWRPFRDTTVTPPRWQLPPQPRWVEPLAWDTTGALYSLWAHQGDLWLARSRDRGATWATWRIVDGTELLFFPYLIARGKGELAASWFSGTGDSLRAHVARIAVADDDAPPRLIPAAPFQIDAWDPIVRPEDPQTRSSAGEYLGITFLRDGALGLAAPIQNLAAKRFGFSWRRFEVRD